MGVAAEGGGGEVSVGTSGSSTGDTNLLSDVFAVVHPGLFGSGNGSMTADMSLTPGTMGNLTVIPSVVVPSVVVPADQWICCKTCVYKLAPTSEGGSKWEEIEICGYTYDGGKTVVNYEESLTPRKCNVPCPKEECCCVKKVTISPKSGVNPKTKVKYWGGFLGGVERGAFQIDVEFEWRPAEKRAECELEMYEMSDAPGPIEGYADKGPKKYEPDKWMNILTDFTPPAGHDRSSDLWNDSMKKKAPFTDDDNPQMNGPHNAVQIVRVKSGCPGCKDCCFMITWSRSGQGALQMDVEGACDGDSQCSKKAEEHELPVRWANKKKTPASALFDHRLTSQSHRLKDGGNPLVLQ